MAVVDELRDWFNSYSNRLRMEYANAMSLTGFDPDVILAVQQEVARNMITWLDLQLWSDELGE